MNPQRRLLFLGTVFVVAVLARLAMMPKDVTPRPGSDLDEYDTYAWNMAQGRGYRGPSPAFPDREHLTSWRMPGTSLVFAAVYKLAGHKPSAAAVVNVFMSAATCIALFFIGTKLCDERAGRMVAAVYAVWPHAIFLSTNLWSEPLYVLLLLLFVLHCFELAERPDLRNVLLSGFLLGALLYVRPHALLLPFIGFWIILVYWPYWRKMAAACGIFVVAALMLTPWVIRNYRVHGAFVPFTTQGGEALLVGNNRIVATDPAYYGFSLGDARAIPEYAHEFDGLNEIERGKRCMQLFQQWSSENHDKWVYLLQAKFRRFWTPFLQQPNRFNRLAMLCSWGPVLVLFVVPFFATLVSSLRARDPRLMVHFAIASTLANSLVFGATVRYRFPVEGLCIAFAAAAVLWVYDKCLKKSPPSKTTAA